MSKRNKLIFLIALVFLFSLSVAVVGCAKIGGEFEFDDYGYENPQPNTLEKDEGMNLDGVLDEDVWESDVNLVSFASSVSPDITMDTKTYIAEKGVYFGIIVKDFAVYYSADRRAGYNSGAELYIAKYGEKRLQLNLRLVPTGGSGNGIYMQSWIEDPVNPSGIRQWFAVWEAAATVQGIINTSECEGYTIEVFVPWSTLGTAAPQEYIHYTPAFNHVESASSTNPERTWTGAPGMSIHSVDKFFTASNGGLHDTAALMDASVTADEYMSIDGVLDETVWKESGELTYSRSGADYSLTSNSYISDKGIYLGLTVKDAHVYYADPSVRPIGLNSGVELLIGPAGTTGITEDYVQLRVTATGVFQRYMGSPSLSYPWTLNYFPARVAATIQGTLNTSSNTGYTIEIYIPWESMNVPAENRDSFYLYPVLVHSEDATTVDKVAPWTYNQPGPSGGGQDAANYFVMTQEGYQYTELKADDIILDSGCLSGGYYEKDFSLQKPAPHINNAQVVYEAKSVSAEFGSLAGATIADNGDGTYKLRVAEGDISQFLLTKTLSAESGTLSADISVYYNPIYVDGVLDEEEWADRTYTTKNTANNVMQTTHIYIGENGLNLGFSVIDPNIIMPASSHIELYMTVDDDLSMGNGWEFRFYPDGTFRTYLYSGTTTWTEKTGANKLQILCVVTTQSGRYDIEAYLPYSALGLSEKPEIVNIIPAMYFTPSGGSAILRDGDINRNLAAMLNLENYVRLDGDGLIVTALAADNIVLSDADLVSGHYKKEFSVYTSPTKLNKVPGVAFDDPNITEIGAGTYLLSIPSAAIGGYMPAKTVNMTLGTISASFSAEYSGMVLDGVFDESSWAERTYTTRNTASNVTQTTYIYIGETGIYLGFSVLDPNIIPTSSHIELYMTVDDDLSMGNGWEFRFYPDGTFRTYLYSGTTTWTEKTGANKLQILCVVTAQSGRYDIEAYLPYSVLGLSEKPEIVNMIPAMYFTPSGGTAILRDGDINRNLAALIVLANYVRFDGDGLIASALVADNIALSQADLTGGYYEKEFSVYTSSTALNKVSGVVFDDANITEIGNGVYRLRVASAAIGGYVPAKTINLSLGTINAFFTAAYSEMSLNGAFDETEWSDRTYTTKNTANNVVQTTHIYIGENGLYLGFSVSDPNIVIPATSQLRLYLAVGDSLTAGNGWRLQFYADGSFRTFVYGGGTTWTEKTGALKLQIVCVITMESGRYDIEAYLPYSVLGLSEKPEIVNMIPAVWIVPSSGSQILRDGDINRTEADLANISNYVRFDENGLIVTALAADNIALTGTDLNEGYYEKAFSVYTSSTKLNKVSGLVFDDSNITETGNGTYLLRIPESEIVGYTAPHTVTVTFESSVSTTFQISYTV